jgi:hypothetical protein
MVEYYEPEEHYPKADPEEMRKWEEKRNKTLARKRENRLGHIQRHLTKILSNEFPEDAPEFQIVYEPMTKYPKDKTGPTIKVPYDDSPAYRFVIAKKDNPQEKYVIMELIRSDVDRNVRVTDIPQHYQIRGLGNEHIKEGIEKLKGKKSRGLEQTRGIASIILIIGSLFFLSNNITGYTIANITKILSNSIGVVLFTIGLISAAYYFVKR